MPQLTIGQAFQLAVQHHQAGQLPRAEQLYRQILARQPNHADALYNLGVVACQTGRNDIAVDLIRQALALRPNWPEAYSSLGSALQANGQLEQAIAAHRQALVLKPGGSDAHYNLGNALKDAGLHEQAIASYRQAIALRPDYPEAYGNLGVLLSQNGELDEAIAACRQAVALRPNHPEAHNNLGNLLRDKGQPDEAIASFRQAIALRPDYPQAHSNLGNALRDKGQLDQAIASYRRAIALKGDYPQAYSNLGNALRETGQLDEAIAACRQAISLEPGFPEPHYNLGNALKSIGQVGEAIDSFRHAVTLKPGFCEAHGNLVFALHYHPDYDARSIAEAHRSWARQYAEPFRAEHRSHANDRSPDRRLRIGYFSADFHAHASANFLVPLLERHDPREVELFCYAQVPRPDAITARLQRGVRHWRSTVGLSDGQVAETVRQDRIDILVDLKLHTDKNRLLVFARKPAPVQVTWLDPASTGLTTIDYRLSDPYLDPPGTDESVYSERTIRLPDTFWCYDPLECRDISVNSLPALSSSNGPALGKGIVTFGCLNNFCKVNEPGLRLWAQVLRQVERSRLMLLANQGSHRRRTLDFLKTEGIEPDRVEFVPPQPRRQYMELYCRIDLGLDTFPYNGHTTSLEVLWMGVPVVTLVGQTAVSRAGWSQLSNLGLTELAGHSPEEFVRIAVELAGDLPRLSGLRSTLRQRMEQSPLMDAPRFARNIEAAYRRIWRTWCATPSGN